MPDQELTYRDAGVDIELAERSLSRLAESIRSTHDARVLGGIGSFGALFDASFPGMERPALVSSIDGVGTKTRIAVMADDYSNIGRDIVNHSINDILCQGARPLFFLDYFGCSRLTPSVLEQVVNSAAAACREAGCALIGGETAEMPGVYHEDEIDVVGAIVGVVEHSARLPRGKIAAGDVLIGIASNGLHTNGFSLARRALLEVGGYSLRDEIEVLGTSLAAEMLRPHRSYLNVWPLLQEPSPILALAHVTGGGIPGNLPRVLPNDVQAMIERRSFTPPPIFRLIQEAGAIDDREMFRTFNMGIGMILVVRGDQADRVCSQLLEQGELAAVIGELQKGAHDVQIV